LIQLLLDIGGLSDRGYNSMSSEDARRFGVAVSCTDTADVIPETVCKADDAGSLRGKSRNIRAVYSTNVFLCLSNIYTLRLMGHFRGKAGLASSPTIEAGSCHPINSIKAINDDCVPDLGQHAASVLQNRSGTLRWLH